MTQNNDPVLLHLRHLILELTCLPVLTNQLYQKIGFFVIIQFILNAYFVINYAQCRKKLINL